MRRKPYQEGNWFAVPIESGYVLGRIARVGRRGGILLGYFFKPLRVSLPTAQDTVGLTARDAFDIGKFTDTGLLEGSWPIIHRAEDWRREDWPMPEFGRIDDFVPGLGHRVLYDESELSLSLRQRPILAEQALKFPEDGLSGHLALQTGLEIYFTKGPPTYNPEDRHLSPIWYHGLPDSDVDYSDPRPEIARRMSERRRRNEEAEAPLVQDLAQAGYPVASTRELLESGRKGCVYRTAIPILLHWLTRIDNMSVRAEILKALSVPWAKPAATPVLIEEFKNYPMGLKDGYRADVANALGEIADQSFFDEIVELVTNRKYGKERRLLVPVLKKSKNPNVVDILIGLLDDEHLAFSALVALGKFKPKRARPAIEPLLDHPMKWCRDKAKRLIERIDKAGQ